MPRMSNDELAEVIDKGFSQFSRHLNEFSSEKRGPIIEKAGTHRQYKYRFVNPFMAPFIIIRAVCTGMLPSDANNSDLSPLG